LLVVYADKGDLDMAVFKLPLLPLRDIVVFPHMVVPLYVGRQGSIRAVAAALGGDRRILLAAQREAKTNSPTPDEIYEIGCVARIIQHIKRPDGTVKILVEGQTRVRINNFVASEDALVAMASSHEDLPLGVVESVDADTVDGDEDEHADQADQRDALDRSIRAAFAKYVGTSRRLQPDVLISVKEIDEPARLSYTIAAHLPLKHAEKQAILEVVDIRLRLERVYEALRAEMEIFEVERKIRGRVKKQMERSEKEYYLNEQMRAIQKELGDRDELKNELEELFDKLADKDMPAEVREKAEKELKKLKMMQPMSAEATVVRNYVDWFLMLPWNEVSEASKGIGEAQEILDEDHHGLDKPKERILEFLAVHNLVEVVKGPILCFVGPPGVGKTSLARSIARATGREFVRASFGGVRDEAEIRGHRRTYIGAMPGKIIQGLKRAGTSDPVFLFDELDKLSSDFRGDPASALLEVLDPNQNNAFNDHYLDVDYDLSKVMFICTANSTQGIPHALHDRLEVIRIAGYTEDEKMAIAKRYLIPKQRQDNGVDNVEVKWREEATRTIIQRYTREAGVRTLEREIASVCRKIARDVVQTADESGDQPSKTFTITSARVKKFLGVAKYRPSRGEESPEIGMATGLAWTQVGGEVLQIEAGAMPGGGKLMITGKLGDVMQESARAAMSYVRARAASWGLRPNFYQSIDLHVHVPEGAMPKDGPSAGITICTSLVSALTQIPCRHDVAMTGEITLRGNVLPIGGLKEKALAAHRAGIVQIIIPKENEKDIEEIRASIQKKMTFYPVEHVDEVLRHALELDDPEEFITQARAAAARVGRELIDGVRREEDKTIASETGEVMPATNDTNEEHSHSGH